MELMGKLSDELLVPIINVIKREMSKDENFTVQCTKDQVRLRDFERTTTVRATMKSTGHEHAANMH